MAEKRGYCGYYTKQVRIRIVETPVLAGMPNPELERFQIFERDEAGDVLLPSKCVRAMLREAFRAADVGESQSGWRYCYASSAKPVRNGVPVPVSALSLPSPPVRPGQSGTGLNTHEALMPGTEIDFEVSIPANLLPEDRLDEVLGLAGKFIGLSPAKAKLGYGRFEVVSIA